MKTILISIRPKWAEKILNGEKTIEIRKGAPKDWLKSFKEFKALTTKNYIEKPEPMRVVIYCTKAIPFKQDSFALGEIDYFNGGSLNGKVVTEFTLNEIKEHKFNYTFENPETYSEELTYNFNSGEMKRAGFDKSWDFDDFLESYGKGKTLYAWNIDNLKIYDKPKELSDFGLKKAPQSWCYVEEERELEDERNII